MTMCTFTTDIEGEGVKTVWQLRQSSDGDVEVLHIVTREDRFRYSQEYESIEAADVPEQILNEWADINQSVQEQIQ